MHDSEILECVAGKGFLRCYIGFCGDLTDAPHIFHLGVGLTILGAAMGSNVRIPSYGGLDIYPNLWLVLIAPSGFMRKSTALYQGKSLLAYSVEKAVLPDDWTPEKLAAILEDNPAGLLVVSEFTRLLGMLDRDYNKGAREMLTELYDSPERCVVERAKGNKRVIENAAVSLLGATTLDWLEERVKAKDLRGGFLARFLFLPATERGPRVEGRPHVNQSVKLTLKDWLWTVAELEGVADYSDVWNDYSDWLYEYERKIEKSNVPGDLMGVLSRAGTTTLKLALLFQASLRPQLRITAEAMEMAQQLVSYLHYTTQAVARGFADDWFEKQMQKVMRFLVDRGGVVTRQALLRALRGLESRKLDSVLKTLREQGRIEISQGEGAPRGGPKPTIITFVE
jgi:hypothetical protein